MSAFGLLPQETASSEAAATLEKLRNSLAALKALAEELSPSVETLYELLLTLKKNTQALASLRIDSPKRKQVEASLATLPENSGPSDPDSANTIQSIGDAVFRWLDERQSTLTLDTAVDALIKKILLETFAHRAKESMKWSIRCFEEADAGTVIDGIETTCLTLSGLLTISGIPHRASIRLHNQAPSIADKTQVVIQKFCSILYNCLPEEKQESLLKICPWLNQETHAPSYCSLPANNGKHAALELKQLLQNLLAVKKREATIKYLLTTLTEKNGTTIDTKLQTVLHELIALTEHPLFALRIAPFLSSHQARSGRSFQEQIRNTVSLFIKQQSTCYSPWAQSAILTLLSGVIDRSVEDFVEKRLIRFNGKRVPPPLHITDLLALKKHLLFSIWNFLALFAEHPASFHAQWPALRKSLEKIVDDAINVQQHDPSALDSDEPAPFDTGWLVYFASEIKETLRNEKAISKLENTSQRNSAADSYAYIEAMLAAYL